MKRFHAPDEERTRCVSETVRILRDTLPPEKAVIGFSAAPFTLCAYMIEGGTSRDFSITRQFAHEHPAAFADLLERSADALIPYLKEQATAGANVLQLFDTWGSVLPPVLHRSLVLPMVTRVIEGLGSDRPPVIYFPGIGSEGRLVDAAGCGSEGLSIDWQTDLARAYERVGDKVRLQGNLDPTILLTDPDTIRSQTLDMLAQVPAGRPHLVNLGHGILKQTDPDNAAVFIDTVQSYRPAQTAGA